MINKSLLTSKLVNKFNTLTLHSIVNECFINGLPVNPSEITDSEKIALTKYSYKVLDKVGGFKAIESALHNPSYSDKQKMLVADIYTICTEASKEAAKRICGETDCNDPTKKFDDVVDSASFTDTEYKKFVTKAESLDLDTISNIIKEKTLNVIKDEQEQYEKEEELDNELKDALADSKDFSEATTESYMDIVLRKEDPRHHVSLFSKLQDSAMEMMSIVKVGDDGKDVMPIIDKVTFESFLDDLRSTSDEMQKSYESYVDVCNEEVCNVNDSDKAKMSMLVSIIVYSVLETLKTMNIYSPSQVDVKKFVNKTADAVKVENANADSVLTKAQEMLESSNVTDYTKANSTLLAKTLDELKRIAGLLNVIASNNQAFLQSRTEILNGLQNQINAIEGILNSRRELLNEPATEATYYDKLKSSNDLSQFNKVHHMFSSNPNVSEIRLKVNPSQMASIIDVDCANESGQIIKKTFMNMEAVVESSDYIGYLKDMYQQSELASTNKRVCITIADGTGKKIML